MFACGSLEIDFRLGSKQNLRTQIGQTGIISEPNGIAFIGPSFREGTIL